MPDFQALLASHGPLVIALAVMLDQLGIPVPSAPTLLFAGSMIAAGDLSGPGTLAAATLASLPPDLLWFELGRRRGQAVLGLLCRISLEPDSCARDLKSASPLRQLQLPAQGESGCRARNPARGAQVFTASPYTNRIAVRNGYWWATQRRLRHQGQNGGAKAKRR